jgi:hypothetical protein
MDASSRTKEMNEFIAVCLTKDPKVRPSATQLLDGPFLRAELAEQEPNRAARQLREQQQQLRRANARAASQHQQHTQQHNQQRSSRSSSARGSPSSGGADDGGASASSTDGIGPLPNLRSPPRSPTRALLGGKYNGSIIGGGGGGFDGGGGGRSGFGDGFTNGRDMAGEGSTGESMSLDSFRSARGSHGGRGGGGGGGGGGGVGSPSSDSALLTSTMSTEDDDLFGDRNNEDDDEEDNDEHEDSTRFVGCPRLAETFLAYNKGVMTSSSQMEGCVGFPCWACVCEGVSVCVGGKSSLFRAPLDLRAMVR